MRISPEHQLNHKHTDNYMNLNEAYPTKYLAASDLDGQDADFVIDGVALETLGQGADKESKLVASLRGEDKQLVLNKTNARAIAAMFGDETDDWIGKPIKIGPRQVEFQGKTTWAIRVITPPPRKGASRPAQPAPTQLDADGYADAEATAQAKKRSF